MTDLPRDVELLATVILGICVVFLLLTIMASSLPESTEKPRDRDGGDAIE